MKMASRSIDLISKKTNCTCSTLFFLISKKTNLHVQHAFCLSLPLFCTTTTLFCRTKTSNFLVAHYFYGGIAYPIFCLLCSCSLIFFTAAHFHLAAAPCWPLAFLIVSPSLWIFMFFFLQNSSLLLSITRCSSFSVIHVSVNIKTNVEKYTTLSLFFLFKSPGSRAISSQVKPWVAFRLPYLLIQLMIHNIMLNLIQ